MYFITRNNGLGTVDSCTFTGASTGAWNGDIWLWETNGDDATATFSNLTITNCDVMLP